MKKVQIPEEAMGQLVEMENSIQIVSNTGFLLSHTEPLTNEQARYATLLDDESKKLSNTFHESFTKIENQESDLEKAADFEFHSSHLGSK